MTDDAQDHARFERAFCHRLGFGTAKCVTKVRALLGHSDPRIEYLEDAVAKLRKDGWVSVLYKRRGGDSDKYRASREIRFAP